MLHGRRTIIGQPIFGISSRLTEKSKLKRWFSLVSLLLRIFILQPNYIPPSRWLPPGTMAEAAGLVLGGIPIMVTGIKMLLEGVSAGNRYFKYKLPLQTLYRFIGQTRSHLKSHQLLLVANKNQNAIHNALSMRSCPYVSSREHELSDSISH